MKEGRLLPSELFWRDQYVWLKESGYLLRPRYSPQWSASWKGTDKYPTDCEDGVVPLPSFLMDATRISDGLHVVLKRGDRLDQSVVAAGEAQIFRKVSSEPLASEPANHCIRLLEILQVPHQASTDLIVIPLLLDWERFHFLTIGEAVSFFSQIFEGLQFMHNHNIWHGDCKGNNIMMDGSPVLRDVPHPWRSDMARDFGRGLRPLRSRTLHPVKYYWIDFDLSGEHDPSVGPPLVEPGYGGVSHVPEFAFKDQKCNPFAVDVWCLGFMIQAQFTQMQGFEFMDELVANMMQNDPAKRPSMDEVVRRFSQIKAGLSSWKLRSRFTSEKTFGVGQSTIYWARQLYFMALFHGKRVPAIPTP
ncbi:kinase-like domain-containing protein [Mycena vitilis]|nr:kinase-like domain-containing protein [Mycena vitilis]